MRHLVILRATTLVILTGVLSLLGYLVSNFEIRERRLNPYEGVFGYEDFVEIEEIRVETGKAEWGKVENVIRLLELE